MGHSDRRHMYPRNASGDATKSSVSRKASVSSRTRPLCCPRAPNVPIRSPASATYTIGCRGGAGCCAGAGGGPGVGAAACGGPDRAAGLGSSSFGFGASGRRSPGSASSGFGAGMAIRTRPDSTTAHTAADEYGSSINSFPGIVSRVVSRSHSCRSRGRMRCVNRAPPTCHQSRWWVVAIGSRAYLSLSRSVCIGERPSVSVWSYYGQNW